VTEMVGSSATLSTARITTTVLTTGTLTCAGDFRLYVIAMRTVRSLQSQACNGEGTLVPFKYSRPSETQTSKSK
jgi:hypothetical protein